MSVLEPYHRITSGSATRSTRLLTTYYLPQDHIGQGLSIYPTPYDSIYLEVFIDLCAQFDCIPIVTINAGIAMKYGPEHCVTIYTKELPPQIPTPPNTKPILTTPHHHTGPPQIRIHSNPPPYTLPSSHPMSHQIGPGQDQTRLD